MSNNFLIMPLLLFLLCQPLNCATKAKTTSTKTTAVKPLNRSQEAAIIEEIKLLLKHGTMPNMSFNDWCDTYVPTLMASKKEPILKLGQTLKSIRQGNVANASAFNILPSFEKAVQVYDEKFHIKFLMKPVIVTKGTFWYFKRSKKK